MSKQYGPGFESDGFAIDHVTITPEGDHYVNEQIKTHAMLAGE